MNKTEQQYLKEILDLENDKAELKAEINNWKIEQGASIKAFGEKEKVIKNLEKKLSEYETDRERHLEEVDKLKDRIKQLTDRNVIGELKNNIANLEKDAQTDYNIKKKKDETIWKKDREIEKATGYIKELQKYIEIKEEEIKNLGEWKENLKLYQQKIIDLENALISLAKQKINNNYEWNKTLEWLKMEWDNERELILDSAERGRNGQAEEIVALETENMELNHEIEELDKLLEDKDELLYKKDETISDLQEQLKWNKKQKSIIGDIERMIEIPGTYPKDEVKLPLTFKEEKIIEQTKAHLANITSERIKERVNMANEEGNLSAYKKLLVALNNPPLYNRLEDYLGLSRANAFVDKLSNILIGKYIEIK